MALAIAGGAGLAVVGPSDNSSGQSPPRAQIIPAPELEGVSVNSPRRVFLEYWSALQFQDWPTAVSHFAADYLSFVGTARTISAMRSDASFYPTARPSGIAIVNRSNTVSIRYLLPSPEGGRKRQSAILRRENQRWRIVFDSALDGRFQVAEQSTVQSSIDALAKTPSRKALQAGAAASTLQAQFQERARESRQREGRARGRQRNRVPATPG